MTQQFNTPPLYAREGCTLPNCLDTGYNCACACRGSHQDVSLAAAVIETTKKSWYEGGWE